MKMKLQLLINFVFLVCLVTSIAICLDLKRTQIRMIYALDNTLKIHNNYSDKKAEVLKRIEDLVIEEENVNISF